MCFDSPWQAFHLKVFLLRITSQCNRCYLHGNKTIFGGVLITAEEQNQSTRAVTPTSMFMFIKFALEGSRRARGEITQMDLYATRSSQIFGRNVWNQRRCQLMNMNMPTAPDKFLRFLFIKKVSYEDIKPLFDIVTSSFVVATTPSRVWRCGVQRVDIPGLI